ncbi:hypothetical protein AMJ86_02805 [bacterium SM23_57]|nr:MAG: hypothetical protein AMJ86_02805 [bacterium SM23_57]
MAVPVLTLLTLAISVSSAYSTTGKKMKIREVEINGNAAVDDHRILRLMISRPSKFLKRVYYYPEILTDDIANIERFYQRNGYLNAKIREFQVEFDSVNAYVDLKIAIEEGPLTRVEGIAVFGNTVFEDSLLLKKVKQKKEDPFKRTEVQNGMLSMLSLYAEEGYLNAAIQPDIRINEDNHLAIIDFIVKEGSQFAIADLRIDTLRKTRKNVVQRELLFKTGEIVRYSRLQESQRRLYLTGLFESVFIRPVATSSGDSTQKDILIEVKESLSSEFNAKAGYGSVEKVGGKVEILTTNLSGTARKISAGASANFIKRRVEMSFTEPWTLNTRFRTDLNLFFEFLDEPGYQLSRYGGKITEGRSLGRSSSVSLSYRYENGEIKHVNVYPLPTEYDTKIRSLSLSLTRDTRDNIFNPKRGTYSEWTNEIAGAFLKGNHTFFRSVVRVKCFKSLDLNTVVGSAIEVGWIDYFGDSNEIPLTERFYAGGPNSLRGFRYEMVGPLHNQEIPVGGNMKVVWNALEIRRAVYKIIGIGAFLDVGNVWSFVSQAKLPSLRTSIGAGIRANTSIGILRLDYGFNINPRDWEPSGQLYFSMGHAF